MQSLLFCRDENSAHALTPLVEGLDISVKRETEVYLAMRTLMAESFDFLIIDCEDEPTGRLILKNARGSAMNKGTLVVAIVNLETGANALRFGADFLITKPVIAGQASKVLRLVRNSILRRQQSSPATRVQSTALETEAASLQSSSLDLATSVISHSAEHSVDVFSDGQADISLTPTVEPETSKIASTLTQRENTEDGSNQGRSERVPLRQELRIEESRIELPHAVGPAPVDPTSAPGVETAPQETAAAKSHQVAKNAATEIKKAQPRLFLVSLAAAIGVIILVVVAIAWHIDFVHSSDAERVGVQPSTTTPAVPSNATASEATAAAAVQLTPNLRTEEVPDLAATLHDSTQGTQVQVDAHDNSAQATPYVLNGLSQDKKNSTATKPGHAPEIRTIKVDSSGKSSVGLQSAPLTATVSVNSDPPGATLWMDGGDTGRATPAQVVVDKPGTHMFVFRKQGYLDETIATNLKMGQTFHLAPSLHALGRTDEIKMVGKFGKLFGGSATAGMGTVKVITRPKGAQIAVNSRTVDKMSPAEFYLNPGNYVIDITLPGFKIVHRVVSVNKGGMVAIDEVMDHE
jgi:hypothetical protein